jgi:hypothetical protein
MPQQESLGEKDEFDCLLRGSAQARDDRLASAGRIVGNGRNLKGSDPHWDMPISSCSHDEGPLPGIAGMALNVGKWGGC